VQNVDEKYYADGEDALDMRLYFKEQKPKPATAVEEEKENAKEAQALGTGD
jgi:hypothetical protein